MRVAVHSQVLAARRPDAAGHCLPHSARGMSFGVTDNPPHDGEIVRQFNEYMHMLAADGKREQSVRGFQMIVDRLAERFS